MEDVSSLQPCSRVPLTPSILCPLVPPRSCRYTLTNWPYIFQAVNMRKGNGPNVPTVPRQRREPSPGSEGTQSSARRQRRRPNPAVVSNTSLMTGRHGIWTILRPWPNCFRDITFRFPLSNVPNECSPASPFAVSSVCSR